MKTAHRWFRVIPCSAMLVLLVSCVTMTIPTDSSVGDMSVEQAGKVLRTRLNCTWGYKETRLDSGSWESCKKVTNVRVTSRKLLVTDERGKQSVFVFIELPQVSRSLLSHVQIAGQDIFINSGFTVDVVNAFNVLKQNAIRHKNEVAEYDASFAASLADYRKKAASNAALPEAANKYKAQAEGAVRDKEFDDAADLYAAALKIAPWWPVGHFNRALVLGETGDYELAKREMNYYLQLVPDAPNARAAQDKIYEWERLETK